MTLEPVAGEKEHTDGKRQNPTRPPEIPVQEGQPESEATRSERRQEEPPRKVAKRRGRPPKAKPIAEFSNPDCSNPACIVTCSPQCENLYDIVAWREHQAAEREARNDPTLRSMDVH